ncbi:coiled-coil domain-containing protein 103 [Acanthochromis polyacanthus]|uniref:coiled-coil domain-containing protein 103 n=1 Tax=Acanthochromis polyacanthus TaxID=80966 RepID=UPI00223410B0|nr:coiled-coil domain-containing protein 103 [Acanthochromis polyacanthus]XP_022070808.2 coiled-coil domain-containing protein 103 [Acanthochromis polyacanthus]
MMSQRDVINFSALDRELQMAVESERRYKRENEAKLKAVSQRVCYSQFRDLVLTCHLKPLNHQDRDGAPRKPWNPVAPGNTSHHVTPSNTPHSVALGNEEDLGPQTV